jgi:zinc protease
MVPPLLVLLFAPASAGDPLSIEHRSFELDNGLRVVLHAEARAPVVSVQLLVAAGAADDPEGQAGAAHLLEHALFTGTERLPGQGFDLALEALGGDANAWTHYDWTGFVTSVPPGALERALVLEAERLAAPSLAPRAVALQRRVVQAEALATLAAPHGQDSATLAWLLYPEHPYGRDITGLGGPGGGADLATVDAAALRRFHRDRYAPSRCVLAIAGDLDLHLAEAWVRSSFGVIPSRGAAPRFEAPAPPLVGERLAWLPADVGRAGLLMGWRGLPMDHPDEPALAMLAWLLCNDGPLVRALVDRGRVDLLQAWSDSWRLGGGFVVSLRGGEAPLEELRQSVDAELQRLAREGPAPGRLERARGAWENRWLRAADPVSGRASLAAQCVARGRSADCATAELARHQGVTPADIQRVAQALVDAPGRVLLSVASEADYERSLSGSEPVELP